MGLLTPLEETTRYVSFYYHLYNIHVISNFAPCHSVSFIIEQRHEESNRKVMNRNWVNQKANPALKTKAGNK